MAKAKKKAVEVTEVEVNKEKRLLNFMEKMEKDFGEGSLIRGNSEPLPCESISTGSIGLDKALGIGGLPKGRVTEIYGPESSGKTTIAMQVMKEAQDRDPEAMCAIVDMEHAYSESYAISMGLDNKRVFISQPSHGEQALEIVRRLVDSGDFDVVVLDSVAALVPLAELQGNVGDNKLGLQARMMGQALRMLTDTIHKNECVVIFINQLREKIGVMFGSPETTPGGNALKFYASIRLDVRRSVTKENTVKDENDFKIGNQTTVKVIKNKLAPPFRQCSFTILYGKGIDREEEILKAAVESDVIKKSGTFFSYNDTKLGQGFDTAKKVILDNPELFNEIKEKVEKNFTIKSFVPTEEELKDVE